MAREAHSSGARQEPYGGKYALMYGNPYVCGRSPLRIRPLLTWLRESQSVICLSVRSQSLDRGQRSLTLRSHPPEGLYPEGYIFPDIFPYFAF